MKRSLADMRREYAREGLLEQQAPGSPFALFERWFNEALETEQPPVEPNAMMVATVDAQGQPHCRVLLLKGFDDRGFVFFTNYESDKGQQLIAHPQAAMTFFWPCLERQVRVEGVVEKTTASESDGYYAIRPLGSRLGAWASPQSQRIESREWLQERVDEVTARFAEQEPERPPHWGGFRLKPARIEFWQGRPSRLHDRLNYRCSPEGEWVVERLAP
mgnify:CR=1 FL=1